jgi:apolipoprotein N-acyltransferase
VTSTSLLTTNPQHFLLRVSTLVRTKALRPFFLALTSCALYLAAFYLPHAWPLVFIALVPLISAARRARTTLRAAWCGYMVGAVAVGASTIWMLMVPSALTRPVYVVGLIISWLLVVIVLGLSLALWAALIHRVKKRTGLLISVILGAALVLFEYLRMHAFNILTYAPGVENPAFFSPGFLGYPLADNPAFLQLAALGGIYLLSFTAATVNVVFAALLRVKRIYAVSVALALLIVSLIPAEAIRGNSFGASEQYQVGFMSIHAPPEPSEGGRRETLSYQADMSRAIEELTQAGADIILLPEGAEYFPVHKAPSGVTVLGTVRITPSTEGGRGHLGMFAGTGDAEATLVRTKQALTPQGEYPILLFTSILGLFGKADLVDEFRGNRGFSTGPEGTGLSVGSIRASVFFCIEMFHPGLGKTLVNEQGAHIIFALLSHAFFSYSPSLTVDTERLRCKLWKPVCRSSLLPILALLFP